jgi:hypothetical protein
MVKSQATGYGVGSAQIFLAPKPLEFNRAPTSSDINYEVGQTVSFNGAVYYLTSVTAGSANWALLGSGASGAVNSLTGNSGGAITPVLGNIDILGSGTIDVAGTAGTLTISSSDSGFPITPYVVGPVGVAGYQTIQSALDAATADGGGIVYVQPGTYTENLTLYGDTEVVGTPGNSDAATAGNCTIIVGVHTPPTSGSFTFANVHLSSATHIFSSVAAGTASLVLLDVLIEITNGFIFNLLNWTGDLITYNVGDISTNNGVVSNTGGATCFFISATHGAGTGQTMVTSGTVVLQEIDLKCPWNAQTGSIIACDYTFFTQTVTLSNNSTGTFSHCRWGTGASAAITMSSSSSISLLSSIITSSNNPAIAGAGAGTLTIGNVTFTSNALTAGTLTLSYATSRLGPTNMNGNLTFGIEGNKISTPVATTTTAGANSFGSVTLVGGTATVSTTSVTTNSLVYIWRQSIGATGAAALGQLTVGTITNGTSFVIRAVQAADATALQASDVSVIGWMIVN